MKNYIRTCLSLDKKTIERLNKITKFEFMTKSQVIKALIELHWKNIKGENNDL